MTIGSESAGRSALVLGATGLVGGHCLDLLLHEERYSTVRVLVRRALGMRHPKLAEHVADFDRLAEHEPLFSVDDVFSCLGTTIRKAGSRAAFWRVDVEYPTTAGRLAMAAGARNYLLVSALGADPASRIPYNRAKGEVEAKILDLSIPGVWIFRPSLLLGHREERRPGERIAELVLRPVTPLLVGPLRRYRPVRARTVAAAMIVAALADTPGRVVESEEMDALASGFPLTSHQWRDS